MASITHVMRYGDQLGIHYDDGTVVMAVPTDVTEMWLASTNSNGGGPGPGGGTFIWPFPESSVSSPYGPRDGTKFHEGIDFGAGAVGGPGTPIPAISDGVVESNYFHPNFGNMLMIDHGTLPAGSPYPGQKCRSLYAHMEAPSPLPMGQNVAKGTTVGGIGNTGASFGAHLHLEIHIGDSVVHNTNNDGNPRSAVDPKPFLDAYL